jgi:hypothetical protein
MASIFSLFVIFSFYFQPLNYHRTEMQISAVVRNRPLPVFKSCPYRPISRINYIDRSRYGHTDRGVLVRETP